jgi:proton-dependent oligopeptide transporter, POT family
MAESTDTPQGDLPVEEKKEDITLRETIRLLLKASKGFWLVNMVNFGDGIAYFGILNLLTLYLGRDVGLSDAWKTTAVSLFTGAVTAFMLGMGFLADRLGVRRALTVSLVVLLAGRLLLVLAPIVFPVVGPDMPMILNPSAYTNTGVQVFAVLALLLMAFGSGILQPTLYSGAKEYTDPRTAAVTFSLVYAIMNFGIAAEGLISPYIRTDTVFLHIGGFTLKGLGTGISGVFWFCAAFTALMLILQMLWFTRKVEQRDRIGVVEQTAAEKKHDAETGFWRKFSELPLFNARFAFFIFILLPVQTLFAHQFLTIPDYIMRAYPASVGARYEWIIGINPVIIVIFVPLISALTRKARVLNMMIIGTTISAAITFILVPGPSLSALLIYTIVFSFGEAVWSSRFYEYVATLAPAGKVGAYMGMAGIPWFLAKATTGIYAGHMLERYVPSGAPQDTGTLWLIYSLIACASPVGLLLGKRWMERGVNALK